ncbi:uncharacterized protein LOC110252602 isoform X1 [Exaiptasia diaphana]|uniref:Uncharacterized protein n=1 Tax=Exaiptasia diaphana TaxID=2652724 RepID=A0A913Y6X8_EXADI|nr:uncharacterized protein LOC110252602 isoform X1 [Exaiptasia diaphana]KXJ22389.1 hypothetical protein AC249_AIPGENE27392 [Exaiptasia diaphana]
MPNKKTAEENTFDETAKAILEHTVMEHSERRTDSTFPKFEQALEEMPRQIRMFSESMKKRFVDQALRSDPESCAKYKKLRNDTKNDALVYINAVLPIVEVVVSEIEGVFEHFMNLNNEDLYKQFHGMLEELQNCRQLCDMARSMNENMMVTLKRREDKAKEVELEIRELQQECVRKQSEFEKSAEFKRKMAIALSFVPVVNLFAAPPLFVAANSDKKDALVQRTEAQAKDAAATAVLETLIPALTAFTEGLGTVAGFLSEMESELIKCHANGERCMKDSFKSFSDVMKLVNASNILMKCKDFRWVLPSVKTDFLAICPDDGTDDEEIDHEYVFTRLKEMMKMTNNLRKKPGRIIDNLKRHMFRQRELASGPSARAETFQFYV